jgi:acyl-coenzyme A thioesterase PaaI-like protein
MLSTLRKNFERNLKKTLTDRGLSLRPTDLAALVEGVAPKSTRVALSFALDLLRPFSAGMGFRVTRLSDRHVELVIPGRRRNQDEEGRIHEGALFTGAIEAARLLWLRHAPLGDFKVHLEDCVFHILQDYAGDLRVRMELPEMQVEKVLSQIRSRQVASTEVTLSFFDDKEKNVAEANLSLQLKHTPGLNAP